MCVVYGSSMGCMLSVGAPVVAGGQLSGAVSLLLPRGSQRSNSYHLGHWHLQAYVGRCWYNHFYIVRSSLRNKPTGESILLGGYMAKMNSESGSESGSNLSSNLTGDAATRQWCWVREAPRAAWLASWGNLSTLSSQESLGVGSHRRMSIRCQHVHSNQAHPSDTKCVRVAPALIPILLHAAGFGRIMLWRIRFWGVRWWDSVSPGQ